MLITTFRRRVLKEISLLDLTKKQFATKKLKIPVRRLESMLERKNLRLRHVDVIAAELQLSAAQLFTNGLQIETGTLPPSQSVSRKAIEAALAAEGFTATDLANALGISRQGLNKDMLSGNFGLGRIEKIAKFMEREPWQLVVPPGALVKNG